MFYYLIAPLKLKSPSLTYFSNKPLQKGCLVEISLKNKKLFGVVLKECEKPNFTCKEALLTEQFFSQNQVNLAEFITSYYFAPRGLAYSIFVPFKKDFCQNFESLNFSLKALNTKQQEALDFISSKQTSLLFGDTGSGKTEIYIHFINKILNEGKNAILLMPEISLTPQMERRLREIFGDILAFWHSKITKTKKQKILDEIYKGKIRILAGARSALFLPLAKVGLIILDEEHDDAYKANNAPSYHTRDVALYLASKDSKLQVLLGSATPLANTYYKFQDKYFRLKGQYFSAQKEFIFVTSSDELSPFIVDILEKNYAEKRQAIVFLPTRGNFKHLICKNCGESVKCPHCSVSMSLHTKNLALMCHYCHFTQKIPQSCAKCGGEFDSQRIGTQEFAQKLKEFLGKANIACFDRDSINTQNKLTKTLESFNKNEIDILVGTQMLSKGHDYHNVALSVALGLDYVLKGEDYRSKERAVALMFQLSGRSGRKESGRVVIQTLHEEVFKSYLEDYEIFLKEELMFREHLYPPFMRLALIRFASVNPQKAEDTLNEALKILEMQEMIKNEEVEIVGYGRAPIEKIAKKWRFIIMLRATKASALNCALKPLRNFECEIDVDPIDFI